MCDLDSQGLLNNCVVTGSGSIGSGHITGAAASGAYFYGSNSDGGVTSCHISGDGTLPVCTDYAVVVGSASDIAVEGTAAWVLANDGSDTHIYACTVNPGNGTVSGCVISDGGLTSIGAYQISYH
jgi:hypothetical protein